MFVYVCVLRGWGETVFFLIAAEVSVCCCCFVGVWVLWLFFGCFLGGGEVGEEVVVLSEGNCVCAKVQCKSLWTSVRSYQSIVWDL